MFQNLMMPSFVQEHAFRINDIWRTLAQPISFPIESRQIALADSGYAGANIFKLSGFPEAITSARFRAGDL